MLIIDTLTYMDIVNIIANNVRKERIKQHLTQTELAEKADLHNNYIGLLERSKCNMSVITLAKLAKALSVQISDLLELKQ